MCLRPGPPAWTSSSEDSWEASLAVEPYGDKGLREVCIGHVKFHLHPPRLQLPLLCQAEPYSKHVKIDCMGGYRLSKRSQLHQSFHRHPPGVMI